MDCQAINREDLAEKYLGHRLDAAQMDEFETHLLECPKCARELELLQTVQADLTERAHEIRGWTAPKPNFFRWQIVVLAGIVIVVATASVVLRWQKTQTASTTSPPPPQTPPPVAPTKAQDSEKIAARKQAELGSPHTASQALTSVAAGEQVKLEKPHTAAPDTQKAEVAKANTPAPDGLPTNARSSIDFTLNPSQTARDNAPSIGPVPTSAADAPNNSVNGAQNPQVATANSEPAVETAKAEAQLTTEQGVELYKLAAVVPPPYTFSGLVAKGKLPDAHDKGKYSSGSTPSDTGRQLFQNAMAGYVEGRYGEAVSFLESAVQKEPKAADVNFYLGVCKLLLGHPQESIAPLKQAVAAGNSPYLQSSHYYLAKAYLQQEKFEEAEGEFHDAATISGRLTSEAKSLLARTQAFRAQLDKK
jgi:hypothetical protein